MKFSKVSATHFVAIFGKVCRAIRLVTASTISEGFEVKEEKRRHKHE